jgi:hypothetical protein
VSAVRQWLGYCFAAIAPGETALEYEARITQMLADSGETKLLRERVAMLNERRERAINAGLPE